MKRVKELGMEAAAITDHGVVAAAISFYKEAEKVGIKPIIGCEFYCSPTDDYQFKGLKTSTARVKGLSAKDDLTEEEEVELARLVKTIEEYTPDEYPAQQCYHLTALAMNADGVSQLYQLSSIGFLEGYYYKPRVSVKLIEEIGKDLIILGACAKGPVSWNLRTGRTKTAEEWAGRLKETFPGRFYLELMDHGLDWQESLNTNLESLSRRFKIPWVPTNDAHFLERNDHYSHCLMMCLQLKQTLDNLTMKYPEECYVKSPEEMIRIFGEDSCRRTVEVAEMIDIHLELGKSVFPEYRELQCE